MWEMVAAWCGIGRPLHDSLDEVIERHDGVVVPADPSTKSSTIAWFRSVREALDAALEVVAVDAQPPRCSIGIAAGEIEMSEESVRGPPLDEAQRLAQCGDPGIFVTDTTRMLAPADRFAFEVQEHDAASPVAQLVGYGPGTHTAPLRRLPARIAAQPELALIGRAEELALFDEALDAVSRRRHRELLLGGEAGAGKTRLMRELASRALERGSTVLYGRCQEGVERPYLPFAQAVSDHLGQLTPVDRANLTRSINEDLAPLTMRPAPSADPETDQHWMLHAVSTLLTRMVERAPVVMVIEDVHLAGRPTRTLLGHLMSAPPDGLLLAVTFRDAPIDLDGELGTLIDEAGLAATAGRRSLPPLVRDEVVKLVSAAPDVPSADVDSVADLLHERAGGNPLLTHEMWVHFRRSATPHDWSSAVPASIVDLASKQLQALPEATRTVVELGATMGAELDLELMTHVLACDVEAIVSRATPAIQARLLAEEGPGRLRFVHSLIADSIVHALPLDVRLHYHHSLVRSIGQQPEPDLMLMAHHAVSAVPLISAAEAVRRSEAAAEAAMQSVAFGDAVTVLERALEMNVAGSRRAELLLTIGRAAAIGGDAVRCVEACGRAAALARDIDDRRLLRDAALVAADLIWTRTQATTDSAVSLIEDAVTVCRGSRDRSRLLAALASMSALAGDEERSVESGKEAIRLARESGDPALLLNALHRNMYREIRPADADSQVELTREATRLADEVNDDRVTLRVLAKTLLVLTVVCEPSWLVRTLARFDQLARRLREPLYLMTNEGFQTLRAVSEGRLDEAETMAELASDRWANPTGYGVQMFSIRREQDRIAELRPVLEAARRLDGDPSGAWLPGLAVIYAETGMLTEARSLLADLVRNDLAMVARDSIFPGVLSYLADVATASGDRSAASLIHDHLVPYEGMLVTFPGIVSYGSADRFLGRLCETMGRQEHARTHFERAVEIDESLGWTTWAAHSRFELGRHLVANGDPVERRAGVGQIQRADRMARSARLVALGRRCRRQLGAPDGSGAANLLTKRELEVLTALSEGRTNREIGERLNASRHTVANHVRAILAKTGTANRTEAARWAHQRGMVGAPSVSPPAE